MTGRRWAVVIACAAVLVGGVLALRPDDRGPFRDDVITVFGGGSRRVQRSADIGEIAATEVVQIGDERFVVASNELYPMTGGRLGEARPFDSSATSIVLGTVDERMVVYASGRQQVVIVDALGDVVATGEEKSSQPVLGPDGFLWWTDDDGEIRRQHVDDIADPAQEPSTFELQSGRSGTRLTMVGAGVDRAFVSIDDECSGGILALDAAGREESLVEFARDASCADHSGSRAPFSSVTDVEQDDAGNLWIAASVLTREPPDVLAPDPNGLVVRRASDGALLDGTAWISDHPFLGRNDLRVAGNIGAVDGSITFGVEDDSSARGVVEVDDPGALIGALGTMQAVSLPDAPATVVELSLTEPSAADVRMSPEEMMGSGTFNVQTSNRWFVGTRGVLTQVDPDGAVVSTTQVGTAFGGLFAFDDGVMQLTCPNGCDRTRSLAFVASDGSLERRPLPVGHVTDVIYSVDPGRRRVMLLSGGDEVEFSTWWLPWPAATAPTRTGMGQSEADLGVDADGRLFVMRASRLTLLGEPGADEDRALAAEFPGVRLAVPTAVQLAAGPKRLDELSIDVDAVTVGEDGTIFIATADGIVLSSLGDEPVRYLAGGAEFVDGAAGDLELIFRLTIFDGALYIDDGSIHRIELDEL